MNPLLAAGFVALMAGMGVLLSFAVIRGDRAEARERSLLRRLVQVSEALREGPSLRRTAYLAALLRERFPEIRPVESADQDEAGCGPMMGRPGRVAVPMVSRSPSERGSGAAAQASVTIRRDEGQRLQGPPIKALRGEPDERDVELSTTEARS